MVAHFHQNIQLYLKALIWTLNKLLNSQYKIEGKHNLKQILETAKSKIKEHKGQASLDYFNRETDDLQKYIEELVEKIKATPRQDKMDFTRYPIDEKYENHFYVDEIDNVEIDLENFVDRFQRIKEALDERVSYFFYQELNQEW